MNVLVVSGIWPPDVGGPASHAPDVAAYLRSRGHGVEVVTTAAAAPATVDYPVRWVSRSLPKGVVHVRAAAEIAAAARHADVVYTTGMFTRTAAACTTVRRRYVVKLTGDPAFERARWRRNVDGDVSAFQHGGSGAEAALLRALRNATLRGAAHVLCPSAFLADLAVSWGVDPARVSVLPNPAPDAVRVGPREDLRRSFGVDGPTLAFAGRLGPQKALNVALDALAGVDGVSLLVAGEGEQRSSLDARAAALGLGGRVRFLGALPRDRVLEMFAAADAVILSSAWENFPHTVVEALAVGTPVIATAVGGVPEVVVDGENGLLVSAGDADALAAAIGRFFADVPLQQRLRADAAPSVARLGRDAVYGELERVLASVAR